MNYKKMLNIIVLIIKKKTFVKTIKRYINKKNGV